MQLLSYGFYDAELVLSVSSSIASIFFLPKACFFNNNVFLIHYLPYTNTGANIELLYLKLKYRLSANLVGRNASDTTFICPT
jgi:hypothetical protein